MFEESRVARAGRRHLSKLLGMDVPLEAGLGEAASKSPRAGEVVLLENCRFNKGEKKNDEALSQKMAALCDVYVNDAFGTAHRAEATTHGIARFAPVACAGPLMAAEIDALGRALENPARPLVAIVGGSKVSTKLTILASLAREGRSSSSSAAASPTRSSSRRASRSASRSPNPISSAKRARSSRRPRSERRCGADSRSMSLRERGCADARAEAKAADERRGRRSDPRHRPRVGAALERSAREGRHDRLERPGRRLRVSISSAPARRPSPKRSRHRRRFRSPAAATRSRRSPSTAWRERICYISTGGGAFLEFLEGKKLPAIDDARSSAAADRHDLSATRRRAARRSWRRSGPHPATRRCSSA